MPSVYDIVTEKIIRELESGVVPWSKPWQSSAPCNLVSRKPYRGINCFLLTLAGRSSQYWLTYKQAQDLGGHVRKGEHSQLVVYCAPIKYKRHNTETDSDENHKGLLLRYYNVFSVEQCDGLELPEQAARVVNPIESADLVIAGMPNRPAITNGSAAWYRPSTDTVCIPLLTAFDRPESYYSTIFHELTHSTGHTSRIGREGIEQLNSFGSESYSREELIAELGASMLCGSIGISSTIQQSASYLASWIRVLRGDSKLVVSAASAAQKAADYILGKSTAQDI